MEHVSEEAPLAADGRVGSDQALVPPAGPRGGSNSQALKIAGITTLVCLLVSAQVFTAYMLFDQKQQIHGLQSTNRNLQSQMSQRSRMPPARMVVPDGSLALDLFDDAMPTKNTPKVEPPKVAVTPPTVEKQLQELIKDQELPQMNKSFMDNLQTMKQGLTETEWKSFESWMRYWLIFQMAQKTPSTTPQPDGVSK